ncbi:MAG: NAD-dependent deacylase, partial [Phycisphaerales bacterium]|nr:NAD-dependent deacylase [Phycisphaerales bacterium]
MESGIDKAAAVLRASKRLTVLTGAGMSAESGVPTFRDPDGYWSRFNPAELATPAAFRLDPVKVWEWYRLRRAALRTV